MKELVFQSPQSGVWTLGFQAMSSVGLPRRIAPAHPPQRPTPRRWIPEVFPGSETCETPPAKGVVITCHNPCNKLSWLAAMEHRNKPNIDRKAAKSQCKQTLLLLVPTSHLIEMDPEMQMWLLSSLCATGSCSCIQVMPRLNCTQQGCPSLAPFFYMSCKCDVWILPSQMSPHLLKRTWPNKSLAFAKGMRKVMATETEQEKNSAGPESCSNWAGALHL